MALASLRLRSVRSVLRGSALCLAFLWGCRWLGGCFAAVNLRQVAIRELRSDEGLELSTAASRRNFAPINRVSGEIVATEEEMRLASELRFATRQGDWYEARRILSNYYGSNTKVLTAGMQAAMRCRRYEEGATIFEQLQAKDAPIDLPAYTVAMKIYGKLQKTEQVDEIWTTLKDLDAVDQVAAGARIDAAVDAGDLDTALEVVAMMIKNRLGISVLHFSSAINACAKSKDPERHEKALSLWNDMISRGIKPNIITYTNFLLASRDLPQPDLLFILDSMEKKGVQANKVFVENFMFAFLRKERGKGRNWKKLRNIQKDMYDFDRTTLQTALELIEGFRQTGIRLNKSTNLIERALIGILKPAPKAIAGESAATSTERVAELEAENAERAENTESAPSPVLNM